MNDKLLKIQQELKAPKSEYNNFAKFAYRSAEAILEAVKPLVHKQGLTIYLSDEVVSIGTSNYVKATATLDDGENRLWVHAFAREEVSKKGMDTAQITGSTSSYARKYALNGLFAIDDTKDADSHDNTKHESDIGASYTTNAPATAAQATLLLAKAKEYSGLDTKEAVLNWFFEKTGMQLGQVKKIEVDNVLKFMEEERDV